MNSFSTGANIAESNEENQVRLPYQHYAFSKHPGGTRLTVTEEGFEALPDEIRQRRYTMNSEGWGIQVKNIATYVQSMDDDRK